MCPWHTSTLECRSFFLCLLPTSLWWSLFGVPAALHCPAMWFTSVMGACEVFGEGPLRMWLFLAGHFQGHRRGGGSVGLFPVTQRTFWLQSHFKGWKFPGGEEKAQVLVLGQGLQQWRAYSNYFLSAYNPLATAQTSKLQNEAQMVAGERPRLPELIMESWR